MNVSASFQWVRENLGPITLGLGGAIITVKLLGKLGNKVGEWKIQRVLDNWSRNSPKDVVILHTLERGLTVPNLSPFAMKLETFLKMANIPYELDYETPMGPVGKTPWITLNGEHFVDSQLIVEMLIKKYEIRIGNYGEEQQGVAYSVRVMMDEYLYWGIGLWRWAYSNGKGLEKIFNLPPVTLRMLYNYINQGVLENAHAQGIGRHSQEQVVGMMKNTLKASSQILGKKKFLLGDEPCVEDCSFFGFLSMVKWAAPGSPYEKYMREELPNLEDYCERMKDQFWGTSWVTSLARKNQSLD